MTIFDAMPETLATLADLVDLDRYPIDDLSSPAGQALVASARAALAEVGACDLPGFLRPDAVARAVVETEAIAEHAFRTDKVHDIEFSGLDPATLAADDPRRVRVRTAKAGTAYDHVQPDAVVRAVYTSDAVLAFVSAALGVEPLYRMADPIGAANVMYHHEGDELGWHFDNAEFVVTLLLQAPEAGGVFEYVPMLRTESDRNDAGVAALLAGERAGVRTTSGEAGTLALFRGHWSPHRVTPVVGPRPRLNAVLSYSRRPDHMLSAEAYRLFYGREA